MSQSQFVTVKIPEGVLIRDPETKRVAQTGDVYPRAGFWARRLLAGDVLELAPDDHKTASAEQQE